MKAGIDQYILQHDLGLGAIEELEGYLSPRELSRARSLRYSDDRLDYVCSILCLRVIVGRVLGVEPQNLNIVSSATGRPLIENETDTLHFSLSRGKGTTAIAISQDMDIGIDIERLSLCCGLSNYLDYFLSNEEKCHFVTVPPLLRDGYLCKIWTTKEAALKLLGLGLQLDPKNVVVDLSSLNRGGIQQITIGDTITYLSNMQIDDYSISLATPKPAQVKTTYLTASSLVEMVSSQFYPQCGNICVEGASRELC
ncbi:MAG: 4'-phosphopantetheinyl transferase superfamily protein, partial [Gammaproteobacteria bacterium]|nr:4'-phosphopantetheinyl transferase superfamily protein [Gammaproteobacteria bacterium]